MPLVSRLGAASSRGFGEFNQQAQGKYIEDYFSTYLYTGNGSTQFINTNIPLASTSQWNTFTLQNSPTTNSQNGQACATDSAGNVYVVGNRAVTTCFIAKYNSSGVLQWQSNVTADHLYDIAIDASDNIYICGQAYTSPYSYGLVAKLNTSGAIVWARRIYERNTQFNAVTFDASGNVYAAGNSYNGTYYYALLVKLNSSGSTTWAKLVHYSFTVTYSCRGNGVAVDSSGNVYLSGYYSNDSVGPVTGFLQKFDSSGTNVWATSFISTNSGGGKVRIDSSNNIYVAASGTSGGFSLSLILKYNTSGTLQWQRQFSYTSAQLYGYDMSLDPSGNIYATGKVALPPSGYTAIFVISYDSSGTVRWQNRFAYIYSNWNYEGDGVCANATNVYVTGVSYQNPAYLITTLKLKTDGTASSGSAFLDAYPGTLSAATGSAITASIGMGNTAASVTSTSASITVSTASMTAATYTQSEVLSASGLVWMKGRSGATDHALYDTARGATFDLVSNTTAAQTTQSTGLTGFSASGFSIGALAKINTSSATYASWTFRKAPKFFDVVTFTYAPTAYPGKSITHNLGSTPGMIIVKSTTLGTGGGASWYVSHRATPNPYVDDLYLNSTAAASSNNGSINGVTSTAFNFIGGGTAGVTQTYVAYLFAHDAGGFGADGSQNVISCGSYVGNGSATGPTITLGWEPQFLLVKSSTEAASNWFMFDTMRGLTATASAANLSPNSANAEGSSSRFSINATGFSPSSASTQTNTNGQTYIYMAIRRGPMRTPTDATKVFSPVVYSGSNTARTISCGFVPDSVWFADRSATYWGQNTTLFDRLRGLVYSVSSGTIAETDLSPFVTAFGQSGINITNSGMNNAANIANGYLDYFFGRAPGFFDVVCYTGTGSNQTVAHNLGVAPELIIVKSRSNAFGWFVYNQSIGNSNYLRVNTTDASVSGTLWNNTTPTATTFSVGAGNNGVAGSGMTYVAYLFATCPGVSKVGSYTGTGATQTISCGFTGGARYVLIKRTDSTGSWWVWDTARGMVAGTDPRLAYNSTAAETNANWVYTTTGGFQIVTSDATVNASGGSYIFLAIA